MGWWSRLELTAGQRPHLKPNETELLVQSHVGLYEGKAKAPLFQDGRVYLTSDRICYVDSKSPSSQSIELALADIDSVAYYGGFMRSSAKITARMKLVYNNGSEQPNKDSNKDDKSSCSAKNNSTTSAAKTPTYAEIQKQQQQTAQHKGRRRRKLPFNEVTWICLICFFSNELPKDFAWPSELPENSDPDNFDGNGFPLNVKLLADPEGTAGMPTCNTCGIKASRLTIYKAIEHVLGPSIAVENPASTLLTKKQNQEHYQVPSDPTDLMMMIDKDDESANYSTPLIPISKGALESQDTGLLADESVNTTDPDTADGFACPRCTFINHSSLNFCEICGARLVSPHLPPQLNRVMVQDGETLRTVANSFGASSKISLAAFKRLKGDAGSNNGSPSSSSHDLFGSKSASGTSTPNSINEGGKGMTNTLLYDDDGYILSLLGVSAPSSTFSDAAKLAQLNSMYESEQVSYKLSFRAGGDKQFYENLKDALQKIRNRNQQSDDLSASSNKAAGNRSSSSSYESAAYGSWPGQQGQPSLPGDETSNDTHKSLAIGIHGLQLSDESKRQHNRQVLSAGIEDLTELMTRAKELVKLAEDYAKYLAQTDVSSSGASSQARQSLLYSTQALGLLSSTVVTKDLVASDDSKLYYGELARQLAEFLTDNKQWHAGIDDIDSNLGQKIRASQTSSMTYTSVLDREGGIITLFDLYAVYNRARGVSLVSPKDLFNACSAMEKLQLPITLRKFRSGLMVVQESYKTTDVISRNLTRWMASRGQEYKKKRVEALRVERFMKGYDDDNGEQDGDAFSGFEKSEEAQALLQTILPFEGTGVTAMDVSTKFKWSIMIATEELEVCEERGDLCRDEQVSGTVFYENYFLKVQDGWDWKKEVFGDK